MGRFLIVDPIGPAQNDREQAFRSKLQQLQREGASHGISDNVGTPDLQVVHQSQYVPQHLESVAAGMVWLIAAPVPPQIDGDHTVLGPQRFHESAVHPTRTRAEDETVQQNNRFTFAARPIPNLRAGGIEINRFVR
jgi:hypothetical protein